MDNQYFREGYDAYTRGEKPRDNPYQNAEYDVEFDWWADGWEYAKDEDN